MASPHTNTTRLRRYKKILAIQERYMAVKKERMTLAYIHYHFIEPEFYVSYATFYNYLGVNAKQQIKQLEKIINDETEGS